MKIVFPRPRREWQFDRTSAPLISRDGIIHDLVAVVVARAPGASTSLDLHRRKRVPGFLDPAASGRGTVTVRRGD